MHRRDVSSDDEGEFQDEYNCDDGDPLEICGMRVVGKAGLDEKTDDEI
ncbi:MAG: hypothetical protein ACI9CD_000343 [Candidatus Deianiraeaceae bacterium]|jgi:hypothetical protein